jgi:ABC-type multidrug transport system fused ATPase/permease subunit
VKPTVTPTELPVLKPSSLGAQWKLIKRMFAFVGPVKFQVGVTMAIFVAYICAEVAAVRLLKPAFDLVQKLVATSQDQAPASVWDWLMQGEGVGADLRRALIWLALAKVIMSLLAWARELSRSWQSMSMVFHMRAAVYDRLQRVGFRFHDHYSTGQLINRAISDLQAVRNFITTAMYDTLVIIFSLAGYFAMLVYDGTWEIALAALIPLPLWIWAIRRYAVLAQPIYERQSVAADEMVRHLTENIAGVHVVRAFATEDLERHKFESACKTLKERLMEGVRLRVQMRPLIRGIAAASHIGLFIMAAVMVHRGKLEVGALVSFGAAMGIILARIEQVNAISDAYQHAVVSSARLFEILETPLSTPEKSDAEPLRPGGGAVRFNSVTFGYKPELPVVSNVSFSIPAGSVVALVGPTGAGKTTMAAMLARFYDPDLGRIEIDGQDIRDVTLQSVRDSVGYVFQETYLFSDTIARNIAYSDLNAPLEKIREAARIARAEEFIERLPEKYNSIIGEYGATLSGGQRQRLSIARAILHNPRILVLDDALASVDPETEALIRQGLDRIMVGRTVFMITSRISTARRANIILVIQNGRLVQRGSHEELMKQDGYYRQVASSQFAGSDVGTEQSHMDRMRGLSSKRGKILNEP